MCVLNFIFIGLPSVFTDLSCGADPFPDAEVAGHPAGQETQQQLPLYCTNLLYSPRHGQHSSPAWGQHTVSDGYTHEESLYGEKIAALCN